MAKGALGVKQQLEDLRTIRDLMECWVGAQKQRADLAASTLLVYQRAASKVAAGIGCVSIQAVHRGTLERHRDQRIRDGGAPSTVRLDFQVLRSAWRWGQDIGVCPGRRLPAPKVQGGRVTNGRTPTRGDVAQVLADFEARDTWGYLAVLLLFATGARVGEVTHLRWADVDLADGWLHFGRHEGAEKTGERVVPFEDEVRAALEQVGPGSPEELLLGQSPLHARSTLSQMIRRSCIRVGVEPFTPGGLRRLTEDELYRRHRDPSVAAALLGHSEQTALRFYRKATRDDLRSAVREARMGRAPAGQVLKLAGRKKS